MTGPGQATQRQGRSPKRASHRPTEGAADSDVVRLTRAHKKILTQGLSKVDGRLTAVRRVRAWSKHIIQDLGGHAALSTAQHTLIDIASRHLLVLENLDEYLLRNPSLIDRRKGKLKPLVMDRMRVADSLKGHLLAIGLERRSKTIPALASYVDQTYAPKASEQAPGG